MMLITLRLKSHARWNWDWANKCPRYILATLFPEKMYLAHLVNRSSDFVFGDYGPFEITWRRTA